jgi:hypothetical protein
MQNRHDGVFNALISSCPHLQEINFHMQGYIGDALVDKISRRCPDLTALVFDKALLSVHTVLSLLENGKKFRSLSLERSELYESTPAAVFTWPLTYLRFDTVTVSDHDMLHILQCCPVLQTLTLRCTTLDKTVFVSFAHKCKQLQSLDMSKNALCVDDEVLCTIAEHCVLLRTLDLTGDTLVSDAGVTALVRGCPLLEDLYLPAESDCITDMSLMAIAQHCRGLRRLVLDNNNQITEAGVAAILQACPMLLYLSVYHCGGLSKEMRV